MVGVDTEILVIGAGAAGLACAARLKDAGRKVLVIEARNRIGGRVHTIRERGVVEAGAEFIHGENAVTWELIKKLSLSTAEWGAFVPGTHSARRVFARDGVIRPDSGKLLEELGRIEELLYSFEGNDVSVGEYLDRQAIAGEARFFVERSIGDYEAADVDRVSLKHMAEEERISTNGDRNFWLVDGYDKSIETLAEGVDIRFDHVVEKIEWAENGVAVHAANGACIRAEKVVCTLPLGVLKAHAVQFSPELPHSFVHAVEAVGFGNSTKLSLWLKPSAFKMLDSLRMLDTEGLFGHFWPRTFGDEPVLVGFSGGTRATELTAMSEKDAIEVGIQEVCSGFGASFRNLITHARHFTWSDDVFARGSYSYSTVGMGGAREVLRTPLAGTLFYTGEATNAYGHTATVHGAIEAGRYTADIIAGFQ